MKDPFNSKSLAQLLSSDATGKCFGETPLGEAGGVGSSASEQGRGITLMSLGREHGSAGTGLLSEGLHPLGALLYPWSRDMALFLRISTSLHCQGTGLALPLAPARGHGRRGVTPQQCQQCEAVPPQPWYAWAEREGRSMTQFKRGACVPHVAEGKICSFKGKNKCIDQKNWKTLIKHSNAKHECYTWADTQLLKHTVQPCGLQTEVHGPALI